MCRVCLVLVLLLAHCGKPIMSYWGCVTVCMHAELLVAQLAALLVKVFEQYCGCNWESLGTF